MTMRNYPVYLSLALPLSVCAAETPSQSKPNIIYILADDLGKAELGCYGQQLIETPNIDALSQEGMTFSNHYAGTAVSAPSRCVLLTGKHSGHAYIRGNDEMGDRGPVKDFKAMYADSTLEGQRPLPAGTVMIPALMKKAGYKTACIGKWGLGYPGSESTPNKMGFDFFYGYNCQRQAHTYYPQFLYRNECREYLDNEPVYPHTRLDKEADPLDEKSYAKYTLKEYAPDLMYDELINFVSDNAGTPFMLFWANPSPHVPLQGKKRWVDYYVNKFGDEKPYTGGADYFPCRYPRATYAAMVSEFDEQVGGLVAMLKEKGIYENTVIIFTSDNGPTFNGGTDSYFFDSAKPCRSDYGWGKASLHEGGLRVPMIVSWPGKIAKGSSSSLLCAFWDVMPTLCDIAGVPCVETDGISFLPELLGKEQPEHESLYWEFPESGGQKAIRMGKWKGLILDIFKGGNTMQLFDLESDPREQTDVARYHPDIVKQLRLLMTKEHQEPEVAKFKMPE